ncbi:MAG TPA: SiaB family protein kinase [Bacteroidales bacterium]|nr:SiaB family protein kinase [Bacteroidales bacterium]
MDLISLIRDKMMQENLMFIYRGVVTDENSVPLIMLLENEMESSEFDFLGRKRLFMFVLESLQNVSRHSDPVEHANMSLVVYSKTSDGYTVTTGNVLPASHTESLQSKLEEINNLDAEQIRKVYRNMLGKSEFSNKGGVGLGLLEMARKTGNRLDYDFIDLNDKYSYFILSKTVDSLGRGNNLPGTEKAFNGTVIAELERMMARNNICLIWSGHISPDIGKEVVSLTETKMYEEEVEESLKRKVFSVLVEILQNVESYCPGREAEKEYGMSVAILGLKDGVYSLTSGNLILNERVDELRGKIDIINRYDEEELKDFFRVSLSGQTTLTDSTGNMGLIEIARKSGSKLDYQFKRLNDMYSYYLLTVKV